MYALEANEQCEAQIFVAACNTSFLQAQEQRQAMVVVMVSMCHLQVFLFGQSFLRRRDDGV